MEIQKLILKDFRNYEKEEIIFSPGTNVIWGDNAQGKTNLLEAVCMFAYGRSRRANRDTELIRFGEKRFFLSLDFADTTRSYNAVMQVRSDGKKMIKINNVAITKLSQLMSYLNVVMFSPEELELIKGSPSVRRKFMDEAISQLYPKYIVELTRYYKALEQKNVLLKQLRLSGKRQDALVSAWNEELATSGALVEEYRRKFMIEIAEKASKIQNEISKEKLSIEYVASVDSLSGGKEEFFKKLEASQGREIDAGASIIGIQRDDIKAKITDKDARFFASQGQQRTAVLSLKLAQTEFVYDERGEYPVLLLDDIMSELDFSRREFLSGKIKDKQVLITGTDAEGIDKNPGTKYFKISKGRLV